MVFNSRQIAWLCYRLTIHFFVCSNHQAKYKCTVRFYSEQMHVEFIFNNSKGFVDIFEWNERFRSKSWEIKMIRVMWVKHKNNRLRGGGRRDGRQGNTESSARLATMTNEEDSKSCPDFVWFSQSITFHIYTISFNSKTLPAQPWYRTAAIHKLFRWARLCSCSCVCVSMWRCEHDIIMRAHFMWYFSFQPVESFIQQVSVFPSAPACVALCCFHHSNRVGSIKGVALINYLLQFTFSIVTIQIVLWKPLGATIGCRPSKCTPHLLLTTRIFDKYLKKSNKHSEQFWNFSDFCMSFPVTYRLKQEKTFTIFR